MSWHVYILENHKGKRYVGSTGRTPRLRLAEHNAGLNHWTRAHRPWHLLYCEEFDDKAAALARERFLKTGAGRRLREYLIAARRCGTASSGG